MKSRKLGDIEVTIENAAPVVPYYLTAQTFTGKEKIVIKRQERTDEAKGFISKPISTEKVNFYLKSDDGTIEKEYIYENDIDKYVFMEVDKIISEYEGKIIQEETDNIRNGEIKFLSIQMRKAGVFMFYLSVEKMKNYMLVKGNTSPLKMTYPS